MDNILLSTEIDLYIETMKQYDLEDIGSKQWLEWHGRLLKLNQQAILEVSNMQEEAVKEYLVGSGKASLLVYEAILINFWKNKILQELLEYSHDSPTSFLIYSVLYHEGVCISLLETILFHSNCCETLGDSSIDLLEYTAEGASFLVTFKYQEIEENESVETEITRQKNDIQFDISVRCISILRYFAEYLESLPLSVASGMYSKFDIPLLLAELIFRSPWKRVDKDGNVLKYIGGKWQLVSGEALSKLSQTEAQIWIGLRQLLLDKRVMTHYDMSEYRKNQFLKLQKYLQDSIIDQLSPLIELKQWLCQLSFFTPSSSSSRPLILEDIPQMKQQISARYYKKKNLIAKQREIFLKKDQESIMEIAQNLSNTYNIEVLEKFENIQVNTCAECGNNATKKCSNCKKEWYCTRNCQVKHWPYHKERCIAQVN